jgi:hydrogenase maturation protease
MAESHGGVLVAGIGNIFLGDDGFGVEVARRLLQRTLPPDVRVLDVGVRSLHLAYELLDRRYDLTVFVDAISRGGLPGTIYAIEPDDVAPERALVDPHSVRPEHVLANLRALGGTVGRVVIVGCEPENLEEGIGPSDTVASVLTEAERLVLEIVAGFPAVAAQ